MRGLIGFFDILGFKSFIKNNSAEDPIHYVLDSISQFPGEIKEYVRNLISSDQTEHDEIFFYNLDHLVFSDTIVFTLKYPEKCTDKWLEAALINFEACSAFLVSRMFLKGLPLRGVIHQGEFFIDKDKKSFAGRGIIQAYELCESLNFASLVFSEEFSKEIREQKHNNKNEDKDKSEKDLPVFNDDEYEFTYLTPLLKGEITLVNMNWIRFVDEIDRFELQRNIEYYVSKSFSMHQKDISNSVDLKMSNTVKVIRKMIQNIHKSKQLNDKEIPTFFEKNIGQSDN